MLSSTDNDSDELESETYYTPSNMQQTALEHTPLKKNSTMAEQDDSSCCSMCHKDYPRGVLFIVANEFCERFSYYGMRAILVIYLTRWLLYTDDTATVIFHSFVMLCYFSPLFGAILSDGYIGKYRTILYLSFVYAVGNIIVSATALPPPERVGPLIGLLLIGIGTGGIKPCVCAFGGDQFASHQGKWLDQFFSIFYLVINLGSFFSMLLTPVLREDVQCFGDHCYPVAFGVPAILMIVSLICFVCGRSLYKRYPPTGNVIAQMLGSILYAIKKRFGGKQVEHKHWLDYASEKYEPKFLEDVKLTLHVLFMFLPLPVFWALFDQQGSRWTLQAMKLNGSLGALGRIRPDQMQAINALLIIVLIPVFDAIIYPLFAKCNLFKRPLQRMVVGMFLASMAFVIAGFLELKIQSTMEKPLASGLSHLRFINASPCHVQVEGTSVDKTKVIELRPVPVQHDSGILTVKAMEYNVSFMVTDRDKCPLSVNTTALLNVKLESPQSYYIVAYINDTALDAKMFSYESAKPEKGGALINFMYASAALTPASNITLDSDHRSDVYLFNVSSPYTQTPYQEVEPGRYRVIIQLAGSNETFTLESELRLETGGVYTVVIQGTGANAETHGLQLVDYTDVPPNELHMLLQTPQYVVLTCGEVMFSVTGLSFAYSQTPKSMKAVVQAGWLMTVGIGNLIVVIFAEAQLVKNQAVEFFMFAILMIVDLILFGIMCCSYVYVTHDREDYLDLDGSHGNQDDDDNTLVATGNQDGITEEMEMGDSQEKT